MHKTKTRQKPPKALSSHEACEARARSAKLKLALKLVTHPPRVKISTSASPELMVSFLSPASSEYKEKAKAIPPPQSKAKQSRGDGC